MGNQPSAQSPGASWISRGAGLLAAAVVCGALALPAAGPAVASGGSTDVGQYVVRGEVGGLADLLTDLDARGVRVERTLGIIDGAVVSVSPADVPQLRALPSVVAVTADTPLTPAGSIYDAVSDVNSALNVAGMTGARDAWADGHTGDGIDVALIDTGVAPVGPLATPGTVVNGPDLSFDSQSPNTRYLDANGHGTFMAGLIAGRATSSAPGAYQGMAPDARIVNVKVGDALGRVDVSQVIAGIDWVVQHAQDPGLNIRVLNLSYGTDTKQSYEIDPLAHAAEVAWRHGIVVVASAGNQGKPGLEMPAADPYVLAVGALDSRGTLAKYDDRVASFSATGTYARDVDLLAPGVRIQGLRVPGSYIDTTLGGSGELGSAFLRGSGTSQAAAITSGAAAVLLSARPSLTPDQVKSLLGRGGVLLASRRDDTRTLDVDRAIAASKPSWRQTAPAGTGTGSLEASRGSSHVNLGGSQLTGERDIFGHRVDTAELADERETTGTWDGGTWNGASWAGASWAGASWAGASWAGASWAGASWAGASWAGASWAGASWTGASWAGASWAGASWAGASWSSEDWGTEDWS